MIICRNSLLSSYFLAVYKLLVRTIQNIRFLFGYCPGNLFWAGGDEFVTDTRDVPSQYPRAQIRTTQISRNIHLYVNVNKFLVCYSDEKPIIKMLMTVIITITRLTDYSGSRSPAKLIVFFPPKKPPLSGGVTHYRSA